MYIVETIDSELKPDKRVVVDKFWMIIGTNESAQIKVPSLDCNYIFFQTGGSTFTCKKVSEELEELSTESFSSTAIIEIGEVKYRITNVYNDLLLYPDEAIDQAGLRILNHAVVNNLEEFPAIILNDPLEMQISFSQDQVVSVGRNDSNFLVFDSSDVSGHHALISYIDQNFYLEDLGSTNGTYLNDQQVRNKVTVEPGMPIILAGNSLFELSAGSADTQSQDNTSLLNQVREKMSSYPILISLSDVVRPSRLPLEDGKSYTIGRSSECEILVGAPFVSRSHCEVRMLAPGVVEVVDLSTNGLGYTKGILKKNESMQVIDKTEVFHFGSGIVFGICFSQQQEDEFVESKGHIDAFNDIEQPNFAAEADFLDTRKKMQGKGNLLDMIRNLDTQRKILLAILFLVLLIVFALSLSLMIKMFA